MAKRGFSSTSKRPNAKLTLTTILKHEEPTPKRGKKVHMLNIHLLYNILNEDVVYLVDGFHKGLSVQLVVTTVLGLKHGEEGRPFEVPDGAAQRFPVRGIPTQPKA
ncbi:hypothetical protein RR48_00026 [Papilio machaon]|uniref:Uncharacterized protein n=1 Tax=Papilio machaon TaxID=76193 RepID=A0A0N1IHQ0_PAPMA|nr:hypothetical protein RR48_00026 [Papilio machaon]